MTIKRSLPRFTVSSSLPVIHGIAEEAGASWAGEGH
jgi:hypothetical protein